MLPPSRLAELRGLVERATALPWMCYTVSSRDTGTSLIQLGRPGGGEGRCGVTFTVPGQPLSVNRLYGTSRKRRTRFKTHEGVAYKSAAALLAKAAMAGAEPMRGPVAVQLDLYFRTLAADADGPVKVLLDSLEAGGVVANDNQVMRIVVTKARDRAHPRAVVTVEEVR